MELNAYCPACSQRVSFEDPRCSACNFKLKRAKFKPMQIFMYGLTGLILAVIISAIIVPLVFLIILFSLFMREKLHVVKYGSDDDNQTTAGRRFVDAE